MLMSNFKIVFLSLDDFMPCSPKKATLHTEIFFLMLFYMKSSCVVYLHLYEVGA